MLAEMEWRSLLSSVESDKTPPLSLRFVVGVELLPDKPPVVLCICQSCKAQKRSIV